MREILFKAKIKNWRELPTEEQWVYGYYVRGFNVYEEPIHIIFDPTTIFENNKTDGWDEIDPDTLCRYTGLPDKNGNKIWENDVVKEFNSQGDEWNLSKVVFAEHSLNLGWCVEGIKTLHRFNRRLFNVGLDSNTAQKSEVIGNIFDNPELLEGGGEDENRN